jgi:hypothetical protein
MKTLLFSFVCALLLCVGLADPPGATAQGVTRVFTARTAGTAAANDTSATLSIGYNTHLEIATVFSSTDTAYCRTEVDYLIGATWILAKRDTIRYGASTTTTGAGRGFIVNAPYTAILTPGATQIRVRNIRAATSDAGTYSQYLLFRKPD